MKNLFLLLFFCTATLASMAQTKESRTPDKTKEVLTVEAACGQCKLGLPGTSCDLAVRMNGQAYFVDGTSIDQHGDAHAKDGFCNAIRKAKVQGEVKDGRFKATYFQLVADSAKVAKPH